MSNHSCHWFIVCAYRSDAPIIDPLTATWTIQPIMKLGDMLGSCLSGYCLNSADEHGYNDGVWRNAARTLHGAQPTVTSQPVRWPIVTLHLALQPCFMLNTLALYTYIIMFTDSKIHSLFIYISFFNFYKSYYVI